MLKKLCLNTFRIIGHLLMVYECFISINGDNDVFS